MAICVQCKAAFDISESNLAFYDRLSPTFNGKKYQIPPPKLCPICRLQRRLAFRNERKLYQRKCDATGKDIISIYSPDKPFKVFERDAWWKDNWDAMSFGRDFDFSKTLNEQLKSLYKEVPHCALYNTNIENSSYTNFALNQKNCYLIFGAGNNEDCMYGKFVVYCKDMIDGLTLYSCELCYEGVASERCYSCRFFVNCRGCTESTMIEECSMCSNCIGCFGLKNKQYCIFNKQYSREEYEKLAKEYEYLTPEKIAYLRRRLDELKKTLPHIQSHIYGSENCTGDNVYNSKNCLNAFDVKESEDCEYIAFAPKTIFTQDCCHCAPDGDRFCYNLCSTVGLENSMFDFFVWYGSNIYYSLECHRNNNLFACVGLRNKSYCILNKQYTPEEYEKMVGKIIEHMGGEAVRIDGSTQQGEGTARARRERESGSASSSEAELKNKEWGEYFAMNISPFAYNESVAGEHFPLSKEQALKLGAAWKDDPIETKPAQRDSVLPGDISQVSSDICSKTLTCEASGKKYKVVPQEFEFYKKMKLPIPRLCPDERHANRLKFHNTYQLWKKNCAKCNRDMQSIYPPEKPEIIYCENCYLEEVY